MRFEREFVGAAWVGVAALLMGFIMNSATRPIPSEAWEIEGAFVDLLAPAVFTMLLVLARVFRVMGAASLLLFSALCGYAMAHTFFIGGWGDGITDVSEERTRMHLKSTYARDAFTAFGLATLLVSSSGLTWAGLRRHRR